jgi:hypothetical protein
MDDGEEGEEIDDEAEEEEEGKSIEVGLIVRRRNRVLQ